MSFQYCIDRCLAAVLRGIVFVLGYIVRGGINPHPDEIRHIPSRDAGRSIKVHIYRTPSSSSSSTPSPVLINFHGSGFLLPQHGEDDDYCRHITNETNTKSKYTVLDVPYRLAPEHPFPAALNDVQDAINYVLGRPDEFDLTRISLSGFSAGANLVLAVSANVFPEDTFRSLIAFYPVTDLSPGSGSKVAPNAQEKKKIPPFVARLFNRCYVPVGVDHRDPRISPRFAQVERFPRRVLMITADGDNLAPEGEELAAQVSKLEGRHVVCRRMVGCAHGWDKSTRSSSPQHQVEAKEQAYRLAVEMLNEE